MKQFASKKQKKNQQKGKTASIFSVILYGHAVDGLQ